jgi:molybdopterin/thiamine biosynthesis adenylyltransferase
MFTISFQENHYEALIGHLFATRETERAAYLFCSMSSSETEKRLLVTEVQPVLDDEIESATAFDITLRQSSFLGAIRKAAFSNRCFVFVHSHPEGCPNHSNQDDEEEGLLFKTAYVRIHDPSLVHASLVFSRPNMPRGRVWSADGTRVPLERVRVIGNRFAFYDLVENEQILDLAFFQRQVLAFGEPLQKLLGRLHVGIAGLGGTGSAVHEQLVRLGVGTITACDPEAFERTNINRVYGSRIADDGLAKVKIAERSVTDIGLGTRLRAIEGSITDLDVAGKFRECDIIFGCTDDEWGRAILTKLAAAYLIPVFDLGAQILSDNGTIKSVRGRVTTLAPNSPCLFCRGVITADVIAAEVLNKTNPDELQRRLREGYVPELPGHAPAVIPFTSSVASFAIMEMLHRLTGYMGKERNTTETILRFDESKISINSKKAKAGCWCSMPGAWGQGDAEPFLDMVWNHNAIS